MPRFFRFAGAAGKDPLTQETGCTARGKPESIHGYERYEW